MSPRLPQVVSRQRSPSDIPPIMRKDVKGYTVTSSRDRRRLKLLPPSPFPPIPTYLTKKQTLETSITHHLKEAEGNYY